jgi:hypothetical protein
MKRTVTVTHQRIRRVEIRTERIAPAAENHPAPPRTGEVTKGEEKK